MLKIDVPKYSELMEAVEVMESEYFVLRKIMCRFYKELFYA